VTATDEIVRRPVLAMPSMAPVELPLADCYIDAFRKVTENYRDR